MFELCDDEKRISLRGNVNAILEELLISGYGEHNLLVYFNNKYFRQLYSKYCKSIFVERNFDKSTDESVLIIPYYDTVNCVRHTLRKIMGIDTYKYEKDNSLVIVDSLTAYSSLLSPSGLYYYKACMNDQLVLKQQQPQELIKFTIRHQVKSSYYQPNRYKIFGLVMSLLESAESLGRKGLCIISDVGSFYLLRRIEELVNYELSYNPRLDDGMKLKAFCCYHKHDFEKVLSKEQSEKLAKHHNRNLLLTAN